MITFRAAAERHHDQRRKCEVWRTFQPDPRASTLPSGFGILEGLDEERLAPGAASAAHPHRAHETMTYVREGALVQKDSAGRAEVVRAGEFQCRHAGRGSCPAPKNASRSDWAHIFRIWLRASDTGLDPSCERKRFSSAERRGILCVVASPDARRGSLRIQQNVLVCSTLLDPGQHLVHELAPGRGAWLHVVRGQVALSDVLLSAGDGVGFTAERSVSLTARNQTEILLLDLAEQR